MTLQKFIFPAALFAMLALGSVPVEASPQHGGGGHGGGGGFHGGGGGGFHGGGMVHGGGGFHGHANVGGHGGFRGDHGFRGRGDFRGDHFRHGFGPGFRFRPRFGLGFGLFLGYPFDYPYYSPFYYPVGPLAFDLAQGYGGVAFSMSPADASVTVDGTYAGTVEQFTDPAHPLNLPPGQHVLVIQAPGYSPLNVTVNVEAGRVIPYEGDLQPN